MIEILHYLRTLAYGNYGMLLVMANAGFISSNVRALSDPIRPSSHRAGIKAYIAVLGAQKAPKPQIPQTQNP